MTNIPAFRDSNFLRATAILLNHHQINYHNFASNSFARMSSINSHLADLIDSQYSDIKLYVLEKINKEEDRLINGIRNNVPESDKYLKSLLNDLSKDISLVFDVPQDISKLIAVKTIKNPENNLNYDQILELCYINKSINLISNKFNEDMAGSIGTIHGTLNAKVEILDYNFKTNKIELNIDIPEISKNVKISHDLQPTADNPDTLVTLIQKINNTAVNIFLPELEEINPYLEENKGLREILRDNGGFNLDIKDKTNGTNFISENIAAKVAQYILSHSLFNDEKLTQEEIDNRLENFGRSFEISYDSKGEDSLIFDGLRLEFSIDDDNEQYIAMERCVSLTELDSQLNSLEIEVNKQKNKNKYRP